MKINGPQSSAPASRAPRAGKAAGGFSLGGAAGASGAAAKSGVAAMSGPTGVASLMALQGVEGVEGPLERRRRAIGRGHRLLDRLEALKLAHLAGQGDADALRALSQTGREDRPESGDDRLDTVLDQVDLRVAVELAKAAVAGN